MFKAEVRIHEIGFCSHVAKWSEVIFARRPDLPFKRVEIEESPAKTRARSDLRLYDRKGQCVLAGEVKLPGTPEGRVPDAFDLVSEAHTKASNAGVGFFFTWNVNVMVLFDATRWHLPPEERRMRDYDLGLNLERREDVNRPETEERVRAFLEEFYTELASILSGAKPDWAQSLDVYFVRAFERQLAWPVSLTAAYLHERAGRDRAFDARLQDWMAREQSWAVIRRDPLEWRRLVDRAAGTLGYVFANRLLFYESVRAKFAELEELAMPRRAAAPDAFYGHFQRAFQTAVEVTGDYETLFYPYDRDGDWLGPLVFAHAEAPEAWRAVIRNLMRFDLRNIRADILGSVFKRLIAPEERRRFGQFYTSEDLADVVNAFCIRRAEDTVLDPACGSGSFLVRAYYRKAALAPSRTHEELLSEVFGVDIALFAAHLATMNLASRDVRDAENYPHVRRGNFFEAARDVHESRAFCLVPTGPTGPAGRRERAPLPLPPLDAVVGNPPYVRQERVPRRGQKGLGPMQAKEDIADWLATVWPRLKLSGRSDLHCYFWPAAAWRLNEGGWLGFLVSSGWLDVEYGFPLQEWALTNFRIHAILESRVEPWFEDARVKTCAVILQRCSDPVARRENLVKFVRLDAPLADILGERADEAARQAAAAKFRDAILRQKSTVKRAAYRIVVKRQGDLWEEGLRAGRVFAAQEARQRTGSSDGGDGAGASPFLVRERLTVEYNAGDAESDENGNGVFEEISATGYGGGKWGKYLRAPDFYFEALTRFAGRLVPLGELTSIRRGITSGCDDFFMVRDVSARMLERFDRAAWQGAAFQTACKRADVESGRVRLIEDGEGHIHPVEACYLAPEVHSLMDVTRPVVRASDLDRLILLVSEPMARLRGTLVAKYLHYGERHTYASKKSQAVPVARRSTCAARDPWYDLAYTRPGMFFWPKAQQYRHIVPANPERLICNNNLYDVQPADLTPDEATALLAVVNSTLVALFKTFYGRYAGTEGNLKTEVVDVNLIEVPDVRGVAPSIVARLRDAFERLCSREVGGMVEEDFMQCHSIELARKWARRPVSLPRELQQPDRRDLDLAVLELLGVADAAERETLLAQLYLEIAAHFRQVRIVETQKQAQRKGGGDAKVSTEDLVADLWDGLADEDRVPLTDWIRHQVRDGLPVTLSDGTPTLADATDMFGANTVFFRAAKGAAVQLALPSRAHAELAHLLATRGIRGEVALPATERDATSLLDRMRDRLAGQSERAGRLARGQTGDVRLADDVAGLLMQWFVHGKPS